MAERKATNKYYPPDWKPEMGSLNKFNKSHALRDRARYLDEGILIIRFEMPYNIWCNGCQNHIGMGVRYNARKLKVGYYYTTPIFKFTMKCHLCPQLIEMQTDPQNSDYTILSGARRKEARWDASESGAIQLMEYGDKIQLLTNPMFKLEHGVDDKKKITDNKSSFGSLKNFQDNRWDDPYTINRKARDQFREERVTIRDRHKKEKNLNKRLNLPLNVTLAPELETDKIISESVHFKNNLSNKSNSQKHTKTTSVESIRKVKKDIKRSRIFNFPENQLSKNAQTLLNRLSYSSRVGKNVKTTIKK